MPKISPTKQKLIDAGYDANEVEEMSKKQMGVIVYYAARNHDIPAPDDIDDAWRLEKSKSDIDKLVSYWKTTKGGDEDIEGDFEEAAASKHALPSELESPFVKKGKKHHA